MCKTLLFQLVFVPAALLFLCAPASYKHKKGEVTAVLSRNYDTLLIEGYTIILNKEIYRHSETKEALKMLRGKLIEVNKLLQVNSLHLKKKPIWIEWKLIEDGAMWYHPSSFWLRINRYMKEKEKCVEINNVKNFISWQKINQPYMVLHELSHAYHDQVLGLDNEQVVKTFNAAKKSKKYESVKYNFGYDSIGVKKAYALDNPPEYFAELTEAYFGENEFYPFNREDLKAFDSLGYELMKKVWK